MANDAEARRKKSKALCASLAWWMTLQAVLLVPFILDPLGAVVVLLNGRGMLLIIIFELLAAFWAYYQFRYIHRTQ